ncbi:MAG: S-methyl-5-thioribose-1-phosphate isomerase [Bacillota bacterium]
MNIQHIQFQENRLTILDQRKLPLAVEFITCTTPEEVADAIRTLAVRGAPAIGIAAAYGMALGALSGRDPREVAALLGSTRPTAVNLFWAIDRMLAVIETSAGAGAAVEEAMRIHREDVAMNERIGAFGAGLLEDGAAVLTHCNAGALATGGHGTALGVIRTAVKLGKRLTVFIDETRPLLQGSRLTAWELQQEKIPCYLITDNMAGHFMKRREIEAVIVGADRIAANGDTANKIGTYSLAILAKEHGIPFYVAAPSTSFDLSLNSGEYIIIEERDGAEVRELAGVATAPLQIPTRNPAFDVTSASYITAIITERGVIRPPYDVNIKLTLSGAKERMRHA